MVIVMLIIGKSSSSSFYEGLLVKFAQIVVSDAQPAESMPQRQREMTSNSGWWQ
jgi:hypothetical protein